MHIIFHLIKHAQFHHMYIHDIRVIARNNIKAGWWFIDQSVFHDFSDHIKEILLKKGMWPPSFAALARTLYIHTSVVLPGNCIDGCGEWTNRHQLSAHVFFSDTVIQW